VNLVIPARLHQLGTGPAVPFVHGVATSGALRFPKTARPHSVSVIMTIPEPWAATCQDGLARGLRMPDLFRCRRGRTEAVRGSCRRCPPPARRTPLAPAVARPARSAV